MRVTLAFPALAVLTSPVLAQGLLVPLTDTRSVSATSDQSSESYQASGFGAFSETASTISNGPGGDFASAFASIDSDILPNSITIAGSAAGNGSFASSFCAQASALGDVTFEVPSACGFRFNGFVEAYDQGWAFATLRRQGNSALLGGYEGLQFGVIPFDDSGYLQPGTYVVSLSNRGGYCFDQYASMNYDLTLVLVPFSGSDCSSTPNSSGQTAVLAAKGTPSLAANDLILEASGGPPGQLSLLLFGETSATTPLGNGTLCLANPFLRVGGAAPVDPGGARTFPMDFTAFPFNSAQGAVQAGETWRFQWIFRDTVGAGLNLSDALWVTFAP